MPTIKAIRIHQYGPPSNLRYEEAPMPTLAAGEVMIKVHAVGVNPVDAMIESGGLKAMLNSTLPLIPGWDVSGVIDSVGEGVTAFKPGEEVFSYPSLAHDGGYAEYVAVPASHVALKPKSLDHVQAAAVPVGALTSWQALFDLAHLSAGQTVLIHAAAGGVGSMAVQLAKAKGARVIGTASVDNLEFLKSLGVDRALDYKSTPFETAIQNIDVVFDLIGGETQARSWKVLKLNGFLVSSVSPPSQEDAKKHNARAAMVGVQPNGSQLAEVARLVDAGKLKVTIAQTFPLAQAQQAQELVAAGHTRGKVVLIIK